MSSEKAMWAALRPLLKGTHPRRIENRIMADEPDVNYSQGWIELKYKHGWPKREDTKLEVAHFTAGQRAWATQRTIAGGRVFLLLKVGESEWILFQGAVAAKFVGRVPRSKLYTVCLARWVRKPKKEELLKWLLPESPLPAPKRLLSGVGVEA